MSQNVRQMRLVFLYPVPLLWGLCGVLLALGEYQLFLLVYLVSSASLIVYVTWRDQTKRGAK